VVGHHAWSLAAQRRLAELATEAPFDLVEFEDYRGAGAVAIDARRAGDPSLAGATLAVRVHTTWEMIAALDQQPRDDLASRTLIALERLALRFADRVLHPAAGPARSTAASTARGRSGRPSRSARPRPRPARSGAPAGRGAAAAALPRAPAGVQGIDGLLRALVAEPGLDVTLTVVGRDTTTAPGGTSMRGLLERIAGGTRGSSCASRSAATRCRR
jgi:hypothetical protein